MNSVSWPVEGTKKVHLFEVNLFVYAEGLRNVVDTAELRYHGKKGGLWRFFLHVEALSFLELSSSLPTCSDSLFRWPQSSILFQTTFFSPSAPSSQASGPYSVPDNFLFSSSYRSQASVPFCPISSNSLFLSDLGAFGPRQPFLSANRTAPFLSDLGALFGSRQSFPRAPTTSLFLGPFQEALSRPPPVIYDALWPRCTRWRAEPSSAAPWESIYR